MVEGQNLRIPIPPLTEERRKDLAKLAGKYAEQQKIAVRNVRRDAIDELKKAEKDGVITQDELKQAQSAAILVARLTSCMVGLRVWKASEARAEPRTRTARSIGSGWSMPSSPTPSPTRTASRISSTCCQERPGSQP